MKSDVLAAVGRALYGERWKSALASDLGVTYRTLHRWVVDEAVPPSVPFRLRPIVRDRIEGALAARKLLHSGLDR